MLLPLCSGSEIKSRHFARACSLASFMPLHCSIRADQTRCGLLSAHDLTTPSGRGLAGMLAVFAEFERDLLRDRVKAGIAQARKEGKPHGRPPTAAVHAERIKELFTTGMSKREIANQLRISRA